MYMLNLNDYVVCNDCEHLSVSKIDNFPLPAKKNKPTIYQPKTFYRCIPNPISKVDIQENLIYNRVISCYKKGYGLEDRNTI